MVPKVVLTILNSGYLDLSFLWKQFPFYCSPSLSVISPKLAARIYLVIFHMPQKWPEINMDLDWNLAALWYFVEFEFYNFCLTRFRLDLIILFWTASELSVQFWNWRLLHWKVSLCQVSQIRRDYTVNLGGPGSSPKPDKTGGPNDF